ncbi:MAG: nucleoside deaminase [Neptuniibacter sp.]
MAHLVCAELDNLRLRIATFSSEYQSGSDKWPFRCCELALLSLDQGNYGVGAVLVDGHGDLLAESGNQVFYPRFDSSAHAEMKVLDVFERRFPNYSDRQSLVLYVSLEPCPMCCTRILAAGIGKVVFLAKDQNGGLMSHCNSLPDAWKNIAQLAEIKEYSGQQELVLLADDLANAQISSLRHKLMAIIRP